MCRGWLLSFFAGALLLLFAVAQAREPAQPPAKPSDNSDNIAEVDYDAVPEGFEDLDKPQTLPIDISFLGRNIGQYMAEVSSETVKLSNPQNVLDHLSKYKKKYKQTLLKYLSSTLPANSQLVCGGFNRSQSCGELSTKTVAVIYNPLNFKLKLFVSPKWLVNKVHRERLPPNQAGWSDLSQFNLVYANGSLDQSQSYNVSNHNVLAKRNFRLISAVSASKTENKQMARVEDLYTEYRHRLTDYSAGFIQTEGALFLSGQSIFGIDLSDDYSTMLDRAKLQGSPLSLFLNNPSQVNIYKDDRLIYSAHYEAGNQQINTSSFPSGSYEIRIEIVSDGGSKSERTEFFSKAAGLPAWGLDEYYVGIGLLQNKSSSVLFPKISHVPVINGTYATRLGQQLGGALSTVLSTKQWLTQGELTKNFNHGSLSSGVVVGWPLTIGASLNASYSIGGQNFNLYMLGDHRRDNFIDEPLQQGLLNSTPFQLSLGYSTALSSTLSFSISSSVSRDQFTGRNVLSYSPSLDWQVYSGNGAQINAGATYSKQGDQDRTIMLNLSLSYYHGDWSYDASASQQSQQQVNSQASVSWQPTSDATHGDVTQRASVALTRNASLLGLNATYHLSTNYANLGASVYRSKDNLQYSLNASSDVVWTPLGFGIGAGYSASGVIVHINSKKPGEFELVDHGYPIAAVATNRSQFVPLSPHHVYHLAIQSISDEGFFTYDQSPREVTLYPGNIFSLSWQVKEKYLVFGRLVNAEGEPLVHATIDFARGLAVTDESGYFQFSVEKAGQVVEASNDHERCNAMVDLKNLKSYQYIGDLLCERVGGKAQ